MNSLQSITETMTAEFNKAAKSLDDARNRSVIQIRQAMADAEGARRAGLDACRAKQREAAELVAESLRLADEVEADYAEAVQQITVAMADMITPTEPLPGKRAMRAIAGGKD